jgi:hypothetical protein
LGYDGIKQEFDAIAAKHKTRLVEGENLGQLGVIVNSSRTFESLLRETAIPNTIQSPRSLNSILERNKKTF